MKNFCTVDYPRKFSGVGNEMPYDLFQNIQYLKTVLHNFEAVSKELYSANPVEKEIGKAQENPLSEKLGQYSTMIYI